MKHTRVQSLQSRHCPSQRFVDGLQDSQNILLQKLQAWTGSHIWQVIFSQNLQNLTAAISSPSAFVVQSSGKSAFC
jgi:hypothetical protein